MISLALFTVTTDYIGPQKNISECKSDDAISVICGVSNPEDIVVTPDNKYLLITSLKPINSFKFKLKDLMSRVRSGLIIGINLPSDDLISVILAKNFSDKQIKVEKKQIDELSSELNTTKKLIIDKNMDLDNKNQFQEVTEVINENESLSIELKEKELIKAQKEKESKNPAILHTTATTGFNTYSFLQFMKNEYEVNDFQMIWFNEAVCNILVSVI